MGGGEAFLLALHELRKSGTVDSLHQEVIPESSSRSKTSFESRRPLAVSETGPPMFCKKSSAIRDCTCSDCILSPYFSERRVKSTPRFRRNPKKNSSSRALSSVTSVRVSGVPASNRSRESAVAKRIASRSLCKEARSIECASTPKPIYGWRVQYFRLCFDSCPARAKFEISYCWMP